MKKALTALLAAGTIAAAAITAPAPAMARNNGGAVAAGIIGGLAVGAILGSAANRGYDGPAYAYGPAPVYYYPRPHCYTAHQKVWTYYGPRWERVRVCE